MSAEVIIMMIVKIIICVGNALVWCLPFNSLDCGCDKSSSTSRIYHSCYY